MDKELPVPAIRKPSGTILAEVPLTSAARGARAIVYAKGSLHDQRSELDRQVAPMTKWTTSRAVVVSDVVSKVESEMNKQRRKLSQLLADATTTTIVVEHRDSLVSFGVEHSEATLSAKDRRIVVVGLKRPD